MRVLSTRIHGILDYLFVSVLIASPFLFGFNRGGAETLTPVVLGSAILIYNIFTDYEPGLIRRITVTMHLWLDAFGGILLALSPWLFGFADVVWAPHLALGIVEIIASAVTRTAAPRVAATAS